MPMPTPRPSAKADRDALMELLAAEEEEHAAEGAEELPPEQALPPLEEGQDLPPNERLPTGKEKRTMPSPVIMISLEPAGSDDDFKRKLDEGKGRRGGRR